MPRTNETFDLVIAANRLPVDRVVGPDGEATWRTSPGGLVTAMESVMKGRDGAWVGWAGEAGQAPDPFVADDGMYLHPVPLSEDEVAHYYEGFSNDTLWPIYHDVIVPATFHRYWFGAYQAVNRKFAEAICQVAAEGATVWVHDYQLQLVPTMVRELRPDVRIGWFNHIPFPPVELFAQLPWRRAILEGLLGADYLGFQRVADSQNFIRACRQLLGLPTKGDTVSVSRSDSARRVRASSSNAWESIEMGNAAARTCRPGPRCPSASDSVTICPRVVRSVSRRTTRTKLAASPGRWKPTRSAPSSPSTTCTRHGSCAKSSSGGNGMWWK